MSKLTDFSGRPHSGQMSNAVVGIVTGNVDPDELGRIQVKYPTLHEEPMSFWIRQASPNAGKERGFYALPEIDDEVLVIFLQGSQDTGVIIGQFWNGVDIPPKECKADHPKPTETNKMTWSKDVFNQGTTDLAKNDRRFWKSRSGHLFLFDDSAGKENVQIWDKSHTLALVFDTKESRILLTNSKGDIHIRTKENLFLEAGKDIKYKAGQHVLGEAAQNIKVKAGMDYQFDAGVNIKMKAGATFKMDGGAMLQCKAPVSKLLGDAMVVVKGGIVMIN